MNKVFDWQVDQWSAFFSPQGIAHSNLLAGPGGTGKSVFALGAAKRLLCESDARSATACGACESCRWFELGNHPDFRLVSPGDGEGDGEEGGEAKKKASPSIVIDQIRELEGFAHAASYRQGNRVVVVDPADRMNAAASNALLKILEEPSLTLFFILVSSNWKRLLPTLRSRCRTLVFGKPESAVASAWLQKNRGGSQGVAALHWTGGAPLGAAAVMESGALAAAQSLCATLDRSLKGGASPVQLASSWSQCLKDWPNGTPLEVIDTIQRWLTDVISASQSGICRYRPDAAAGLAPQARQLNPDKIFNCYNEFTRHRAMARHPLNQDLFFETMAAQLIHALRP